MFSEGKRLGRETKFFEDGQKISEGNYGRQGREGEWLYWHPGGELKRREHYRDGMLVNIDRHPGRAGSGAQ